MDLSEIQAFISGFPDFLIQTAVTLALFIVGIVVYVLLTPHKELDLIRDGNPSASVAFAGIVLGLAIPLQACLAHAFGIIDLAVWGVVILLIQLIAFRVVDMVLHGLPRRIAQGDVAAAIFVFAVKVGVALILAGAVTDPALKSFSALSVGQG
jgi:putative membrane protein